jgi:hypothetical protein
MNITATTTKTAFHANNNNNNNSNSNKRKTIPVTLSWDELKERVKSLSEDACCHDNEKTYNDPTTNVDRHDIYHKLIHWKSYNYHRWVECEEQLCHLAHRGRLSLQQKLQDERLVLGKETDFWHQNVQQQQELESTIGYCQEQKEQLDEVQMKLRASIHQNHEMTRYELEELDSVEYERIQQVPKIKNQISLYAKTTGIKWDYHREHSLAGQVVSYKIQFWNITL